MPSYVASFTYQRSEHDAAARAYSRHRGRTFGVWLFWWCLRWAGWFTLALFLVPFISLALGQKWDRIAAAWQSRDAFAQEMDRAAPYLLACGLLYAAVYWIRWYFELQRQRAFQHECRIEIDETGILCDYPGIRHEADWTWFVGRHEESDVVILLGKTEGYMAMPKRAFASPADFDGALMVVRDKVAALS